MNTPLRQKIVVLTGAGISKESGLDTFRDKDGLWQKHDAMRLSSIEGFEQEPQAVLDFYNARRKQLLEVEPNEAHRLVAELEKDYEVVVVTQNVDDLHERACSSRVVHLHGELLRVCSSFNKEDQSQWQTLDYEHLELPVGATAKDGSLLRPYIVFFGEDVPRMEEAIILAEQADIFVIVGTSLNVYPAAGLVRFVPKGVPIFVIDPEVDTMPAVKDAVLLKETATVGMKKLAKILKI